MMDWEHRWKSWGRRDYALRPPLVTRREGYFLAVAGRSREKGGNPAVGMAYARFAMRKG